MECDLNTCLNVYQGKCNIGVPTAKVKPSDTNCEFYSTSLEEEKEWLRKEGGMMNVILKKLNRYVGDEDDKRTKKPRKVD
tara:strand:- start:3440 stop:3679 length:240 start_codon:yes stop_codon:yes gene_type:complete